MKQNKHCFLILLLTSFPFISGYSQESILASGGTAIGSGGTSSYSVGEIFVGTQTGTNGSVAQGTQQPFEVSTLGNDEFPQINLEMSVYPNPTIDKLNLLIGNEQWSNLTYQFFDINGKILSENKKIAAPETSISMQIFSQGIYFLVIKDSKKTIKTFKIIKK
jgi:hypothetical protein